MAERREAEEEGRQAGLSPSRQQAASLVAALWHEWRWALPAACACLLASLVLPRNFAPHPLCHWCHQHHLHHPTPHNTSSHNPNVTPPPPLCRRPDFEGVQEQLAQVLLSLGQAQQASALLNGKVPPESYYKVRACW